AGRAQGKFTDQDRHAVGPRRPKASSRAPRDGGAQIRPDEPGGWKALAPSAVPHSPAQDTPLALDCEGLRRVQDAFAITARRAARLGLGVSPQQVLKLGPGYAMGCI